MSKGVLCLSVDATLCTIVVGVLSYGLSRQSSCAIKSEVSGCKNLVKNEAKYDILSFHLSKDCIYKCRVWSSMGFEAFKIIMLVLLILVLILNVGMRVCRKDAFRTKRKATKLQSDARKFEKL